MNSGDFVQHSTYAGHFGAYRSLLGRLLNHDPAMFDLSADSQIVDAGCGYGDLLKTLRARGYRKLVGVEPDAACRTGAQAEGLDVREGTLMRTGLPDAFADAVIVNEVFHHVEDYVRNIDELARIVKPGGLLCFLEPAPTVLRSGMDLLTFHTPLPRLVPAIRTRYEVMRLEMDTGLYPQFLRQQPQFHDALARRFLRVWLRYGWFFQFGKYVRTD